MHISEGVLSPPVLLTGACLAAGGLALGLKKTDYDRLPEAAVLAAAFFVASLVHLPIGPAAVHLVLPGICGILLGWSAFPAIFIGLSLQAILFQYGGLVVLGVNTAIMAGPAVLFGLAAAGMVARDNPAIRYAAEFICGAGSVLMSGTLAALALAASDKAFDWAALAVVAAHLPIMAAEGALTIIIVEFVRKVRPEMLRRPPRTSTAAPVSEA
jgi:cobalt/nickel transport system permease protein